MLNVQVEHLDELITITTDRFIDKLNRILHKVMFPRIPCEECGNTWDTISPCAPCNATRAMSSGRI